MLQKLKENIELVCELILVTVTFIVAYLLSFHYGVISAICMMGFAIIYYVVRMIRTNTFFSTKSIFVCIWMFAIGLGNLRLNKNQYPWTTKAWVCYWLTIVCFIVGYQIVNWKKTKKDHEKKAAYKFGIFTFIRREIDGKTFFRWLMVYFIFILLLFVIEIIKVGFLPAFSSEMDAYVRFHVSGLHYFVVSSPLYVSLAMYYWKRYPKSVGQKIFVVCSILVMFAIPFLIVSRQLCILMIILMLMTVLSMREKKGIKYEILPTLFFAVLLCVCWVGISQLRNQDSAYLTYVYDSDISIEENLQNEDQSDDKEHKSDEEETSYVESKLHIGEDYSRLSDKEINTTIYNLYMYVTFNYDNFNYNVIRQKTPSFGARTFFPVLALTGIRFIFPELEQFPAYKLNPIYTTNPILYNFYYDFGIIGIILGMLLIGYLAAYFDKEHTGIIYTLIKGLMLNAITFCFFTNYFSNPTIWVYLAQLWFVYIIVTFKIEKCKTEKNGEQ